MYSEIILVDFVPGTLVKEKIDVDNLPWNITKVGGISFLPEMLSYYKPKLVVFNFYNPILAHMLLVQRVRHNEPFVPLILLFSSQIDGLHQWALQYRIWNILIKPLVDDQLEKAIDVVLKMDSEFTKEKFSYPLCSKDNIPAGLPAWLERKNTSPALLYISSNYQEKIPVSTVAELCNMKPDVFSRIFKEEHGMLFREYVMYYRLKKAKYILETTNTSITDVVFHIGFNDLSYFSKMFKRYYGCTPSQFQLSESNSGL